MIIPINLANSVVLNASGGGTAKLGPNIGQRWNILTASVLVPTPNVLVPPCNIYIGGAPISDFFIDGTYTGNLDSTSRTAGYILSAGDFIFAVWTGGDVGAKATLSIYGQQQYGGRGPH